MERKSLDLNGSNESQPTLKYFTAIVMSGVLAIYGLIIAVILSGAMSTEISIASGAIKLCAGLTVGLCCLFSGWGIGNSFPEEGKAPTRYYSLVMIHIYLEALGLYGLIVALIMNANSQNL